MDKRLSKRKSTIKKHKTQDCKVYECKIDRSHLSKSSKNHLSILFKEAKWFYNYCLSHDSIDDSNTTIKSVPVKANDGYEERSFSCLSSQMKQGIKTRLFGSLMSLKALKQKGYKVGKLKFKGQLNSIPLKQYNITYYIKGNRIKIQGLKKWLRVKGLGQIPSDSDIACATLIKRGQDYFINITTYQDKVENLVPNTSIGIDFGCETQLTFSNGTKVEFQVSINKKIKKLDRKIKRKQKTTGKERPYSKKRRQDSEARQKQYAKLTNRKKDIRNKIVNAIKSNFKYVCFQDESIHAWHSGNHGKKIQFSGIGGIIGDLKHKSHTPIMVDKFFPSTQLCPNCGSKQKLSLSERFYSCNCGYVNDRDVKSAICIENEAMKLVPMERRDFKTQESNTATFFDMLTNIDGVKVKQVGLNECEKPTALMSLT